jgi:hypothetical protein
MKLSTSTNPIQQAGHKFTPNNIKADIGDILEYRFYPDAHWVIRGDFDNPCIPYEYVDTDRTGFSSGPQPVKAITNDASVQVAWHCELAVLMLLGSSLSCES